MDEKSNHAMQEITKIMQLKLWRMGRVEFCDDRKTLKRNNTRE